MDKNIVLFTKRIFYGASNRQNTGPSDKARRQLLRQIKTLMALDSGLEQTACEPACAAERQDRRKLAKSIKIGLGL